MPRTDTHRPSLLDPAEYEFHAAFYQGEDSTMMRVYREEHEQYEASIAAAGEDAIFEGNWKDRGTCDHCGAAFAHGCLFFHVPTGTYIHVGHICAANTISLPSRAALVRRNAERARAAERERIRRQEAGAKWRTENADVVHYLDQVRYRRDEMGIETHGFLNSMIANLDRYGSLFDSTAAAVKRWRDGDVKRAHAEATRPEPVAPAQPLELGRRRITGEVATLRYKDTDFGTVLKMLVVEAGGNKVWGTVPNSLMLEVGMDDNALRGRQVTLTATVEASRDDVHFGFYKRPTGAQLA